MRAAVNLSRLRYLPESPILKMNEIQSIEIQCPYCGESFETAVDVSGGDQDYIEDCYVCCRPINLQLHTDINGEFESLIPRRDDE